MFRDMIVALCLSLILNLVLAFLLVLRTPSPAVSKLSVVPDAPSVSRSGHEGVAGRLPKTDRKIVANASRECAVSATEMGMRFGDGQASYWQRGDDEGNPFLAIHFPSGGTYADFRVPVDGYVINEGGQVQLRIMGGEEFRAQCKPSRVAVRVMGTSPDRPTHPIVKRQPVVALDGSDLSEGQLDDLVKEYGLGDPPIPPSELSALWRDAAASPSV